MDKSAVERIPPAQFVPSRDPNSTVEEAAPLSLLDYCVMLSRRKRLLFVALMLGLIGGYLSYSARSKIYRVRTTMEFQEVNEDVLNKHELESSGQGPGEAYFATQIKILQSESLLTRVLSKMRLEDHTVPNSETEIAGFVRRLLRRPEPAARLSQQTYFEQISKGLRVKPLEGTRIVEIACDYTDPQIAAEIVNTLTREYMDQTMEERYNAARRTTEWLNRQIDTLRISLKDSEQRLLEYGQTAGFVVADNRGNPAEEKMREIQSELDRAQADRVIRQSHYESALTRPLTSVSEIVENATVHEYQVRLADLERQMADLGTVLTPANPKVARLQAQIDEVRATLEKQRQSVIGRLQSDYETAERRESLLMKQLGEQEQEVYKEASSMSQFQLLKREVETNRQVYESMLQRVKEYGIAVALPGSQVRIVDRAIAAIQPYSPSLPLSLTLGALISVCFASGFVVYREHRNPRFALPGQAATWLNVAELGAIPSARVDGARLLPMRSRWGAKGNSGEPDIHPEVAVWHERTSPVADSIRATLVSILFSRETESIAIVISSPGPGEGKSTVVSNLGIALAEAGRHVLLVDADLRKPRLHDVFGLSRDRGLANLLRGEGPVEEAELDSVVVPTSFAGVSVIPAGSGGSVSRLLYSKRWPALLEGFKARFDTILIDTPPLLVVPEARVLGRLVGAVVLVLSAKRTLRAQALAASRRVEEDGTALLGVILNQWDPGYGGYGPYRAYTPSGNGHESVH